MTDRRSDVISGEAGDQLLALNGILARDALHACMHTSIYLTCKCKHGNVMYGPGDPFGQRAPLGRRAGRAAPGGGGGRRLADANNIYIYIYIYVYIRT